MFTGVLQKRGGSFSRAIGVLLLVFILYGTTVEAAHRHGRILPSTDGTTAQLDIEHDNTLLGSNPTCSDCLICQLHQNFSATLVSVRFSDTPIPRIPKFPTSVPLNILSEVASPSAGRAPPFIS